MSPDTNQAWPLYVVSLKDDLARRDPLERQLREFDLPYIVFDAVDARKGVPGELEQFIDRRAARQNLGREMVNPEFGCALSHMLLYKEILEKGLPGAIILEDDAFLSAGFGPFLSSGIYREFSMLHLSFGWSRIWRWGLGRRRLAPGVFSERVLFNPGLTTGYTISSKAARFILDHSLPLSLPADWPCCLRPLKPRLILPRLVHEPLQKNETSHIESARSGASEVRKAVKISLVHRFMRKFFPRQRRHNPFPPLFWIYQPLTRWHVERRAQ